MVSGFGDSTTPDLVVRAYGYDTTVSDIYDTDTILEGIFRDNNVVDGNEYPVKFKTRSLSVGDIVGLADFELPGQVGYHLVSSMGFTLLSSLPGTLITSDDLRERRAS